MTARHTTNVPMPVITDRGVHMIMNTKEVDGIIAVRNAPAIEQLHWLPVREILSFRDANVIFPPY